MATSIESEAGVTHLGQRRRQKARRTGVEVHGVAVKQQHSA
jgi:hypothetical protein